MSTAGAGNAGQVAAFLTGDGDDAATPEARDAAKVLDDLVAPTPVAKPEPAQAAAPKAKPAADDVLAGLTTPTPAPTAAPKPTTPSVPTTPPPATPKADQDVLDDLMG